MLCVCVRRCTSVCMCVCVSWQTQMAGGQGGRWAKWTGSSKGEFWLRGSDGRMNRAQSYRRYRTQGVGYTPGHKGHTHTHTLLYIYYLEGTVLVCVCGSVSISILLNMQRQMCTHMRVYSVAHRLSHGLPHPLFNQADPLKRPRINCQRPCLVV